MQHTPLLFPHSRSEFMSLSPFTPPIKGKTHIFCKYYNTGGPVAQGFAQVFPRLSYKVDQLPASYHK